MPNSEGPTCEVRIEGTWQRVSAAEAHRRYRDALKRCPACHGEVRTVGHHLRAHRAMMQHIQGHDGCPLIPSWYCGVSSPHPDAVG